MTTFIRSAVLAARAAGRDRRRADQARRAANRFRSGRDIHARYGLTTEAYAYLYEAQQRRCPLCDGILDLSIVAQGWSIVVVDHDHRSDRVRGLLHNGCNRLLGFLERLPREQLVGLGARTRDYLSAVGHDTVTV